MVISFTMHPEINKPYFEIALKDPCGPNITETRCTGCNTQELSFGSAVRQAREKQGWTQERLAEAMGCADRTVRRIEGGDQGVELREVQLFARVLGDPRILKVAIAAIRQHTQEDPGAMAGGWQ